MHSPPHLPALPLAAPTDYTPVPYPAEEPSRVWLLAQRYRWPLLFATLACAAAAWLAGSVFARPQWVVDGTLLHNPMPLPERHRGVVLLPTLRTYSGWVTDAAHLEAICREFNVAGMSPDDFGARCVKVDQPGDTQTITIKLTYPDKAQGEAIVNRLMEMFIETVATKRREAVLIQSLQTARQNLDANRSEADRLGAYLTELQRLLDQGRGTTEDQDPNVTVRRSQIWESIRKDQARLDEELVDYGNTKKRHTEIEDLVRKGSIAAAEMRALRDRMDVQETRIKHLKGSIQVLQEEMRTLPIAMARSKRADYSARAAQFRQEVEQLEAAMAKPGVLPAALAGQGIDAREFTVKSVARGGDFPATSNRKSITLLTFLGLMLGALGLAYGYDQARSPAPVFGPATGGATPAPARLTRVVQVDRTHDGRPAKVTVAQVDDQRMTVRIDNWIKGSDSYAGTTHLPVTLDPEGNVEEHAPPRPPSPTSADDVGQMALRIHHWLGRGPG